VFLAGIEDDMAFLFKRFRADGTAAVTIGRQLEDAEGKRRQCESTCTLIKRWWSMEELARMNKAEPIDVESEVRERKKYIYILEEGDLIRWIGSCSR